MSAHKALFATVLKGLGHRVPTDEELDAALRKAMREIKEADGVDPDQVKYKVSLTPVDAGWVATTFD